MATGREHFSAEVARRRVSPTEPSIAYREPPTRVVQDRAAYRLSTGLHGQLRRDAQTIPVTVADVSEFGARLEVEPPDAASAARLRAHRHGFLGVGTASACPAAGGGRAPAGSWAWAQFCARG